MENVSSSSSGFSSSVLVVSITRRLPAVSRKRWSFVVGGAPPPSAALSGGSAGEVAGPSLFFSFAFLRIFTRSTMRLLHLMVARRGVDAGNVNRLGVFPKGVEQRGRCQRVDQARDAGAQQVNLFHRGAAEGIAAAPGDADAVIDVSKSFLQRERFERVAHADALSQRRVRRAVQTRMQLRLADQDHRQQILIIELKVREQADLIERRFGRNEL